ncbi:MAG: phosphate acyltransferase PlsX [Chloroflexi bacterium]|nr:phosphate acyltransferase PlsX [Chloroflexota bacterium]MCI0867231.1 phosphate acyltransferase PlsX [Chloroflexota bacterium]
MQKVGDKGGAPIRVVPIRVVIDAMGGDYGPAETVKGALQGLQSHNIEVILVGDQQQVETELSRYDVGNSKVSVVPSVGKIGDDEHPLEGLRHKPKSSIMVATKLLKSGKADLLVSMGSTGASMASAVLVLGLMDGLERPCIGGPFLGLAPRTVLLDMGTNIDCRPQLMLSFATLGSVFAHKFLDIENPRIGLLSVGSEAAKGNRQVQETYSLLQESQLNFIGNVEGMDFFTGRADVIVCDGFVGNILMKFTEGFGTALSRFVEKRLASSLSPEDLAGVTSDLWQMTNMPRTMGGPLFGVNGAVMLGHGSCLAAGVAGAINTGVRCVQLGLVDSLREGLSQQHSETSIRVK